MKNPKNQNAEVLFLLIHEKQTRRSIFLSTDILNPSARISNLRKLGCDIYCTYISKVNKFGRNIKYGIFELLNKEFAKELYDKINK